MRCYVWLMLSSLMGMAHSLAALEKIKGKEDWAECRWQELLLYYAQRLDRVGQRQKLKAARE